MNKKTRAFFIALVLVVAALLFTLKGPRFGLVPTADSQDEAQVSMAKSGIDGVNASSAQVPIDTTSTNTAVSSESRASARREVETLPATAQGPVSEIYGQVFLPDHQPVAEAQVFLVPLEGAATPEQARLLTGFDGSFRFRGNLSGAYSLYASRGNLLSFNDRRDLAPVLVGSAPSQVGPVNLMLKSAQLLRLRALNRPGGKAIVGAEIQARGELVLRFSTKADGEAQLVLAPGIWALEISAKGFAPYHLALNLNSQQPELIEVVLEQGGKVRGVVTDVDHKLLSGIQVLCISGRGELSTRTDVDGSYFFDQVPLARPFTLHFSGQGFSDAFINGQQFILDQTRRVVNAVLIDEADGEEPEWRSLMGSVFDNKNQPVARALVYTGAPGTPAHSEAISDHNGIFKLKIPNEDYVELWASADGHQPYHNRLLLKPSATASIYLDPQYYLAGRVLDPNGAPVFGALLETRIFEGKGEPDQQVFSDSEGRFRFEGLPEQFSLKALSQGFCSLTETFSWKDNKLNRENITITMRPKGVLRGKLVAGNGRPIEKFTLQLSSGTERYDESDVVVPAFLNDPGASFWSMDGSFSLRDLPPGMNLKVKVIAPGYAAKLFVVKVAASLDDPAFELVLDALSVRVAGRLFNRKGLPLAGVPIQVLAYDKDDPYNSVFSWNGYFRGYYERNTLESAWTSSSIDGSFEFEGMPQEAALNLLIASPDLALTHLNRLEGLSERELAHLRITVPAGAALSGHLDPSHYPLVRRLELTSAQNQAFSMAVVLDESRQFHFSSLPAGSYRLELIEWEVPEKPQSLGVLNLSLSEGEQRSLSLDASTQL